MPTLSLTCSNCGAPLEVPEQSRFITCGYCSSRLEVHRSGGAVYTEVLEAIQARTEQIADDVEQLKLQNELERIDREWMLQREECMVQSKNGGRHVPSKARAGVMAAFLVVFTLIWMGVGVGHGGGAPVAIFGLIFLAFGGFAIFTMLTKADEYERGERAYRRRREAILRKIDSQRPPGP